MMPAALTRSGWGALRGRGVSTMTATLGAWCPASVAVFGTGLAPERGIFQAGHPQRLALDRSTAYA